MENPASEGASRQASRVPPGSTKTVACVKRSDKMNRFPIAGTLNSGGPESEPTAVERPLRAGRDQPQEDVIRTIRESDPPIVVRDGNADHKTLHRGSDASHGEGAGRGATRVKHSPRDTNTPGTGVKLPTRNGNRPPPQCGRVRFVRASWRSPVR
jgi:hypothetical protein